MQRHRRAGTSRTLPATAEGIRRMDAEPAESGSEVFEGNTMGEAQ